ncbi:MAG TPA: NADH-quinone oxidoreductase subunit B family protein [Anaerolineaceae bacterium]|nr:NADH-quinone oxidoreductase subunit B family protein [Anaerolineaceae bacterium]
MTMTILWIDQLSKICRQKSPWVYHLNAGSCNGCDIEIAPCFCPRYDAEQIGVLLQGSPKHADILLITGPVTLRSCEAVKDIYNQMPRPKAVVAIGSCPATGNVFAGSPTVLGSVESIIPVDVYVPGCPPRPQAILEGIQQAARLLAEGKTGRKSGASS